MRYRQNTKDDILYGPPVRVERKKNKNNEQYIIDLFIQHSL